PPQRAAGPVHTVGRAYVRYPSGPRVSPFASPRRLPTRSRSSAPVSATAMENEIASPRRRGKMSDRGGAVIGSRRLPMRRAHLSVGGLSILFALGLAAWEIYFFWYAGSLRPVEGRLGWFTSDRLGFNMAWLAAIYLSYQLISIPFSLPSSASRFVGV